MGKQPAIGRTTTVRPDRGPGVAAPGTGHRDQIVLHPGTALSFAARTFAVLLVLNLLCILTYFGTEDDLVRRLCRLFLFDAEGNFATLFNFSLLVASCFLLTIAALAARSAHDPWQWHWFGLAGLFLFLSYDEAAQFHEKLMAIGRYMVRAEGIFFFSWVVPGALFVLVVAAAYLRFVLALPIDIARLVVLGGALYVSGAIGLELLGGAYASQHGLTNVTFHLIATVEETLEMVGLMVFAYGVARHMAGPDGTIAFRRASA